MIKPLFKLAVTAFIASAAALSNLAFAEKAPPDQAALFAYRPADAASMAKTIAGPAFSKPKCCTVSEYKLPRVETGGDIELTLVTPLGKGKHSTVLWLHREGAEIKRAIFLQEAEQLATSGVASILVELPFKKPYLVHSDNTMGDADSIKNAVIDSRRVIDWAATRPELSVDKLAVVGHRFGAWTAALLTAVDSRIDAAVLMSPPGKPSGWLQVTEQPKAKAFREGFDKNNWIPYLASIEPLDPERWMRFAAPAKVHFQFASSDAWVQTLEQVDLYRATSSPKSREMFDADELLDEAARKERLTWLKKTLTGK